MNCHLCEKPIRDYNSAYHHLVIDEQHAVDICPECLEKIGKWQGKIYAALFPTRALKKRFGGKR
jgi:hypothetical protein